MSVPGQALFDRWAELYDATYAAKGKDYRGEAARLLALARERLAPRPGGAVRSLLDVACGTGEHVRFLRQELEVAGVDRSDAMLRVARRKLPGVRLERADMTTLRLGRRFDLVTCLFSSVGYLDGDAALREAIRRMAGHLEPGGLLLVEPALTPERLQPPRTSTLDFEWGGARVRRTTTARHEGDVLRIRFEYRIDQGHRAARLVEEHPIRLFTDDGYRSALGAAGLEVDHDPHGLTGLGLYLGRAVMGRARPRGDGGFDAQDRVSPDVSRTTSRGSAHRATGGSSQVRSPRSSSRRASDQAERIASGARPSRTPPSGVVP
jgi:SAM-dependent methyltransferase